MSRAMETFMTAISFNIGSIVEAVGKRIFDDLGVGVVQSEKVAR